MLHNLFFWFGIALLVTFIAYAIWDDCEHNEHGCSAFIYMGLCCFICIFIGISEGEQGERQGAYNQMRGKYEITYKTTIITNGDKETKTIDTIIHVK